MKKAVIPKIPSEVANIIAGYLPFGVTTFVLKAMIGNGAKHSNKSSLRINSIIHEMNTRVRICIYMGASWIIIVCVNSK